MPWPRGQVRSWLTDALIMLAAFMVSWGQYLLDAPGSPAGAPMIKVTLPLSVLPLLWRRRRPVVVTAVGCLFAAGNLPLPALIGLTTMATRRRDRALAVMSVVVYVVLVLEVVLRHVGDLLPQAVVAAFVVGAFTAFGAYVGARRDLLASLRDRADRAENERELRADQARLGERSRIAQEMHDVLAHKVSLIALHAGGLEVAPAAGPERVEQTALVIRSTAREALEDLRDVLGVLRVDSSGDGAPLAPQPKLSEVDRLVESSRAAGVQVDLRLVGDVFAGTAGGWAVPDQLGRTAYRVVQEALTNVHKHARGAATTVCLEGTPGTALQVTVSNIEPVAAGTLLPGAGAGLVGLRERVELAGGTLISGPQPDGGWAVLARLPWPRPDEASAP